MKQFVFTLFFATCGFFSFSQGGQKWATNGNNASSGDFLGTINNADLDFKTNSLLRLKINSDGSILAKKDFTVNGIMTADSIVSHGGAHIFGQFHSGSGSLVSGSATTPIVHDYQTTTSGNMILGNADPYLGGPNPISAFKLGLGIQIPQFKVHVGEATNTANYLGITNQVTNQLAGDGFKIGISSTGAAELRQQENLDMNFFTNNIQRAVIKNSGLIGMGVNTAGIPPVNSVQINSGIASNIVAPITAASPTRSGLRLNNLNATMAVDANNNSTNTILSVNNTGDIILVKDGPGSGGAVTAQNGLSNVSPSVIELGGILLHPTTVDQATYNMVWNNTGVFGVGDGLTTGNLSTFARARFRTANYIVALNTDNAIAAPSGQNVFAGQFNCFGSGGANGTANVGVAATAMNNPSTNTGFYSIVGNTNAAASNIGFNADVKFGTTMVGYFSTCVGGNNTTDNRGIYTTAQKGVNVYGASIYSVCDPTTTLGVGIYSKLEQLGTSVLATSAAVSGENVDNTSASSTLTKYGVQGLINFANGHNNVAVAGILGSNGIYNGNITNGGVKNVAVYGGFGTNFSNGGGNYAGYFNGDVVINGNITGTGTDTHTASDAMFKTNVDTISNPLSVLKQLKPKTFFYDTANAYGVNFGNKRQYGFVAQDVQSVLPELVSSFSKPADFDTAGNIVHQSVTYKTLNYNAFLGLLTAAVQKQQSKIEHQDSIIKQLVSTVNSCCSSSLVARSTNLNSGDGFTKTTQDIKLTLPVSISIGDARPNPNSGRAEIDYYLPQNVSSAKIIFTDMLGNIINESQLGNGYGTLNIDTKDLPNGIYNYSLLADGKVIETKKMVKHQ